MKMKHYQNQKDKEKYLLKEKDILNKNNCLYNFIIKTFNFFVNRYYLHTLHQYDLIPFQVFVMNLKLFQEDKLICVTYDTIYIYRLTDKILLSNIINVNHQKYIEFYQNDKFFLFGEYLSPGLLKLYHFTKNQETNLYSCINITNINEHPLNILFQKNKMFCICKGYLSIYNIFNDINFELQTKIRIPQNISDFSLNKGFLLNNNNLKIIEYYEKMVILDYNNYKFQKETEINEKFYLDLYLIKLNNNILLFGSDLNRYIFLYSNQTKQIIFKIYCGRCEDIILTKNGEIYLINLFSICYLDIKNKIIYEISRNEEKEGKLKNPLIALPNNIFICNSEKGIKFFKYSSIKNIKQDFLYYLFTLFLSSFRYLFIKIDLLTFLVSNILSSLLLLWLYKKVGFYNNFNILRIMFYIGLAFIVNYFFKSKN